MFLVALRLPGNIERRLCDLQTVLFRYGGLLSARALPPLVPLALCDSPPELEAAGPAPLPAVTLRGSTFENGNIIVEVDPAEPLHTLAKALLATTAPPSSPPPLDVPRPAVLLAPASAFGEEAVALEEVRAELPSVSGAVFRTCSLLTLEIEQWDRSGPVRVAWQELSRKKLRKKR